MPQLQLAVVRSAIIAFVLLMAAPSDGLGAGCEFDIDGNGATDVAFEDANGDGCCEFPAGKTALNGSLVVAAGTCVEFSGKTTVDVDTILVEEGGVLVATAANAERLTLIARTGDLVTRGTLDLHVDDDLVLEAKQGSINLLGPTSLDAADRMKIQAHLRSITIAPPVVDPDGPFTVFAEGALDIFARGLEGNLTISRARIGSRRLKVSTRSTSPRVGPKLLLVNEGAVLSTNLARLGLERGSVADVRVEGRGPIVISGNVELDSGRNVRIQTARSGEDLCLVDGVRLEARDARGRSRRIDLRSVRGRVVDDGTTTFDGAIRGEVETGPCEVALLPTEAPWRFYARIARTSGSAANVNVPLDGPEPPIVEAIRADHLPAFALNDQSTGAEIGVLGGDTLARLANAAEQYILNHPEDYPDFTGFLELRWAMRVAPPTSTSTPVPTAVPTPVLTAAPTPTLTAVATVVPTDEPTPVASGTALPTSTPQATIQPTIQPTIVATPVPTVEPTPVPTEALTPVATGTVLPDVTPIPSPTAAPPLETSHWRLYARVARTSGTAANVNVPLDGPAPPIPAAIRADHTPAFALDHRLTGAEIGALGGDTLARLANTAEQYIQSHPQDYPNFAGLLELKWAKRMAAPIPTSTPTPTATATATPVWTPDPSPTAEPILALAHWRFYVRIARVSGTPANVDVPLNAQDEPVGVEIPEGHLPAFPIGHRLNASEIEDLGGDTLARLAAAAEAYIENHPEDYATFASIIELKWATRVDL